MDTSKIEDIGIVKGLLNEYLDKISILVEAPSYTFDIMGRDKNVIIIHFNEQHRSYSHLRGAIIDIEMEKFISRGTGELTTVVSDQLITSGDSLELIDETNMFHSFKEWKITPGYDGMVVRVFKSGGKVYHATHKTLDFHNKKWGIDKRFGDMWNDLKGPTNDQLFGEEENSGYCYHFLLAHKNLQVGNRFLEMSPGFMVLLDKTRTCYPETEAPFEGNLLMPIETIKEPFIGIPKELSLKEANDYLKFGLYDTEPSKDVRLRNGEFVIVMNSQTGELFRVISSGYRYRISLRNDKAYIRDRFLELFQDVLRDKRLLEEAEFLKRYIPFKPFDVPCVTPEIMANIKFPLTIDMALKLIFRCFLAFIPPSLQLEYKGFLSEYFKVRKDVTKWITNLCLSKIPPWELASYHKRIQTIISQARKYARNGNARPEEMDNILKTNIKYMVDREYPFSLYKIHRIMMENNPKVQQSEQNVIQFVYESGLKSK